MNNLYIKLKKLTKTYDFHTKDLIYTNHLEYSDNIYNAYKKSLQRISNIIQQIHKNIHTNTNTTTKIKNIKYQIKSYYEYNIVRDYCNNNNITCYLIIDNTILTNKVICIKQYITNYDFENNLQKLSVEYNKVPRMYIQVYYNVKSQ